MNKVIIGVALAISVGASASALAAGDVVVYEGPQPVQSYTVCNHGALFATNRRAIPVAMGQRIFTNDGVKATITRSPDVFIQTTRLVRNSYQSLSADGRCP